MTRILLVGAFGQGNPGDDALCESFRQALHGHSLTVASSSTDSLPHGGGLLGGGRVLVGQGGAVDADGDDVRLVAPTARGIASALRHAELVVVGGGTVFKRLHPSSGRPPNALLRRTAGLVAAAHLRGASVALVGVGAGDLAGREAKSLARWIVRHCDLLVLRDEESAGVLGAAGAAVPFRVGADPAWLLVGGPGPHSVGGEQRRAIVVAVSHLAGDDALVERLAEALRPAVDDGVPIRLQPWQVGERNRDAAIARRLAMLLGPAAEVTAAPLDLVAARDDARRARLVVAMRFHAVVAAAAAGTPVLAIAHEPKLAGLARRLGQPAVPPHASTDVLRHALRDALDHPAASAAAIADEAARAREGMSLLHLLADRGETAEPAAITSPPLSTGAAWW